MMTFDLIDVIP